MVQTLNIIRMVYPFIVLAIFFCLYRKQFGFMKRFYWRMTMQRTARKCYMLVLLALLVFLNWCSYETAPNYAVLASAIISSAFMSYRVADVILHRLHERKRLWIATLLLAVVCYATPYMNSVFLVLFTMAVASVFYPSEKVLWLKNHPDLITNRKALAATIMVNYY